MSIVSPDTAALWNLPPFPPYFLPPSTNSFRPHSLLPPGVVPWQAPSGQFPKAMLSFDSKMLRASSARGGARQLASNVAYTDEMKDALINDTLDQMARWGDREEVVREVLALNSSEYHWKCTATPWKLKGGKLGLVVVKTYATYQLPRQVLRKSYADFDSRFDVAYAAAFPSANETAQSMVCAEAEQEGDMLLVNCKESHQGQMFYLLKLLAQQLESVWKGGYKYVIKVDGGTFLHLPHLEYWMTAGDRSAELAHPHVLFGPRIQHYYKSSFIGMSSEVLAHVMNRVEAKWIGSCHEIWLLGLWMRLYGSPSIIDVAIAPEQHVLVPPQEVDIAKAVQVIQAHAKELLFFHVRGLRHMIALRDALSTALGSPATQTTTSHQEAAEAQSESAPAANGANNSTLASPVQPESTLTLASPAQPESTSTLASSAQPESTSTFASSAQPKSTSTLASPAQPTSTSTLVSSTMQPKTTDPESAQPQNVPHASPVTNHADNSTLVSPTMQPTSTDQESSQPQNVPHASPVSNHADNSTLAPAASEQLGPEAEKVRDEANKLREELVIHYYNQRWLNDSQIEAASSPKFKYDCGSGPESGPWRVKGGKLGLFYVFMTVYDQQRRLLIRQNYHNFTEHYDVTFAVGYPMDETFLPERACAEQGMYGDLILVNALERMNDGKGFHAVKAIRELLMSVWKGGYEFVVKVDDDAYIHFPHLYSWMTEERAAEFASSKSVMFGLVLQHYFSNFTYFKGPFVGWSVELFLQMSGKVEAKYGGGYHEDWLLGSWTVLYGPHKIVRIGFELNQFKDFESWESNMTYFANEILTRAPTLYVEVFASYTALGMAAPTLISVLILYAFLHNTCQAFRLGSILPHITQRVRDNSTSDFPDGDDGTIKAHWALVIAGSRGWGK
eukprot:gene20087-26805_t